MVAMPLMSFKTLKLTRVTEHLSDISGFKWHAGVATGRIPRAAARGKGARVFESIPREVAPELGVRHGEF